MNTTIIFMNIEYYECLRTDQVYSPWKFVFDVVLYKQLGYISQGELLPYVIFLLGRQRTYQPSGLAGYI
jgi:hypothetical protein